MRWRRAGSGLRLLEHLFQFPVVNVGRVKDVTGLLQPSANALTNAMEEAGVLREMTGKRTYRVFGFDRYLRLFQERDERGWIPALIRLTRTSGRGRAGRGCRAS